MAELSTLVDDIYALVKNGGHECNPENIERFGRTVSETIARRLAEVPTDGPRGDLRMSSIGKPARQLWYDKHGAGGEREELSGPTHIKFMFGDIIEALMILLMSESEHEVTDLQTRVEVNGVKGSMDAVVDGVVLDVKSASSPSFKKFEYGTLPDNDGFGYMEQISGYSKGRELETGGAFLAVDKTLGKLALLQFSNEELAKYRISERIDHLREVLQQPEPPERCYAPIIEDNGNERLSIGCSYCPYKNPCWADANNGIGLRTFIYSQGPRHYVHVEKEPKVMEVTF